MSRILLTNEGGARKCCIRLRSLSRDSASSVKSAKAIRFLAQGETNKVSKFQQSQEVQGLFDNINYLVSLRNQTDVLLEELNESNRAASETFKLMFSEQDEPTQIKKHFEGSFDEFKEGSS